MEIAPPATEPAAPPAMEAMPVAVEPAAVAAPELTPPGMSHEATSGTKRIMYAPTNIHKKYMQLEPMPCRPHEPICDHELTAP